MDRNSNLVNRHNKVGGQAVIEGVMMKNSERVSLAVRKEDGSVEIKNTDQLDHLINKIKNVKDIIDVSRNH